MTLRKLDWWLTIVTQQQDELEQQQTELEQNQHPELPKDNRPKVWKKRPRLDPAFLRKQ